MKTYLEFVERTKKLLADASAITPNLSAGSAPAKISANAKLRASEVSKKLSALKLKPRALVFAPHPDDESMVSLARRFQTECGFEIFDMAVTLGSNVARRAPRRKELSAACKFLGWKLDVLGFERVTPASRKTDKKYWETIAESVAERILEKSPAVIFAPHSDDWNKSHIGTSLLVRDALKIVGGRWGGLLVETEYWRAMAKPNLVSEASCEVIASLVGAVALHAGEVERNAYHLRFPAYMADNVRRGAELVGGQGGQSPDFPFGQLYRVLVNKNGKLRAAFEKKSLPAAVCACSLLDSILWK